MTTSAALWVPDVGDVVLFPLAAEWNRETPYTVVDLGADVIYYTCEESKGVYEGTVAGLHKLGMVLAADTCSTPEEDQ